MISTKSATIDTAVVVASWRNARIVRRFLPTFCGSSASEIKNSKIPQVFAEREDPSKRSQSTSPDWTNGRLSFKKTVFLFFWILKYSEIAR